MAKPPKLSSGEELKRLVRRMYRTSREVAEALAGIIDDSHKIQRLKPAPDDGEVIDITISIEDLVNELKPRANEVGDYVGILGDRIGLCEGNDLWSGHSFVDSKDNPGNQECEFCGGAPKKGGGS